MKCLQRNRVRSHATERLEVRNLLSASKKSGGKINVVGVKNHHNAVIINATDTSTINLAGVKNHHNAIILNGSDASTINLAGVKNHHNAIIITSTATAKPIDPCLPPIDPCLGS